MFQPGKVNADLMRSSSFQFHIEKCESLKRTPNPVECQSAAAATDHGHARTVRTIASEWLIDLSGIRKHPPVDERNVRLENCAIAKLIGKVLERRLGFCSHQ